MTTILDLARQVAEQDYGLERLDQIEEPKTAEG